MNGRALDSIRDRQGFGLTENSDNENKSRDRGEQSNLRFDDSPQRFREGHPADRFTGSSGMLFEQAMGQTRMAICLTDPHEDDNPIVFANRAFRSLTGYDESDIIGRNCRFLQGPKTDQKPVKELREAIAQEDVTIVELVNYRKDGSSFWNALHIGPIYDEKGRLTYFFGSQWDVSNVHTARAQERHARLMARELSHRMKNMFSVISGIVSVTGRMRGVEREAADINARIQALGRAYETTLDDSPRGQVEIGQAIRAILAPYDMEGHGLAYHGNGAMVPFATVSTVGMILHELAANATKYGAWSIKGGMVHVDWNHPEEGEPLEIKWLEQGMSLPDPDAIEPGTGTAIVDRMLSAGGGTIERRWNHDGLDAVISIPLKG